jgi:cbb3-type cytochrome oxidase subunit 1
MRGIDLSFLFLAVLSLVVGVSLGIWMGIAHDFQFAPVHAHLNLLGWVSLAIFGLAYRAYPALAGSWLAPAHFGSAAVGAVVFPIGILLSITGVTVAVAIVGSLIWLVSVLLFLANLARIAFAAPAPLVLAPAE